MIRYDLGCDQGHTFDGWFRDSATYDKQAKRGLVVCPVCESYQNLQAVDGARHSGQGEHEVGRASARVCRLLPIRASRCLLKMMRELRKQVREECRLCRRQVCRGSAPHSL